MNSRRVRRHIMHGYVLLGNCKITNAQISKAIIHFKNKNISHVIWDIYVTPELIR